MSFFTIYTQFAILFVLMSIEVFSYGSGITGRTTTGCNCHSASSSTNNTLSITGPSAIKPGVQSTFTAIVANQNTSYPRAGLNLVVVNSSGTNSGTLASISGQGTQLSGGEITHTSGKTYAGSGSSRQASFDVNWTAPSTPGIYTIRWAANSVNGSSGEWRISTQTVAVQGITLTTPSTGATLCAGASTSVQWTAFGISQVEVRLSSDGGGSYPTSLGTFSSTDGANSQSVSLPGNLSPGNTYRIRVISTADNTLLSDMTGNFSIGTAAAITQQPVAPAQPICAGTSFSISVVASGASLTYQWRLNGNDIAGATQSTYSLASVSPTNAGTYSVRVNGACTPSPLTSNDAVLTVNPATTITQQPPANPILCVGAPLSLSVTASGSALNYQWKKGGVDISGATQSAYSLPTTVISDSGTYTCAVTGSCSSAVSTASRVTLLPRDILFTQNPNDTTLCQGGTIMLRATPNISLGAAIEWTKNGTALGNSSRISGVGTNTLTIINSIPSDSGDYAMRVINTVCGTQSLSGYSIVKVRALPTISLQPQSVVTTVGSAATFTVGTAASSATYQWKKNSIDISGATSSTYRITSVVKADTGLYSVVVTSPCGSAQSLEARLSVSDTPIGVLTASRQEIQFPTKKFNAPEQTETIRLSNTGTLALSVDSIRLSGATPSPFSVSSSVMLPIVLQPNASVDVPIVFTPLGTAGTFSAQLTFRSSVSTLDVPLSATRIGVVTTSSVINFGDIEVGNSQRQYMVLGGTASQNANLTIDKITLSSSLYTLDSAVTFPLPISSGNLVNIPLRYTPTTVGLQEATATIEFTQFNTVTADTLLIRGSGTVPNSVIEDITLNTKVIPSPASENIRIILPIGNATLPIRIININGTTIWSSNVEQGSVLWNTRSSDGTLVPSGVYRAVINYENENITLPIMIIR